MTSPERSISPSPGFTMPFRLRRFFRTEQAGGAVLLVAALVALVWANSPWRDAYESLWSTDVTLRIGTVELHADLRHAVNEGLMALFFFVVGLEIKRELVAGELRSWRTAALPAIAAVGGMVVPALLYVAVTAGGEGLRGWGVPMATDIAFAVGVVSLLGDRVPGSLKLFLLSLAVVDDIGAIVIIALFYSSSVSVGPLVAAAVLLAMVALLRRRGVVWVPAYAIVGTAVWLALFQAGVQAAIAGAILGLMAPATPLAPAAVAREWTADLSDEPRPDELRAMTRLAGSTVSVAERLEYALHPMVSFAVLPLFALANAGVVLDTAIFDVPGAGAVAGGVVLGLVAGKALGITSFSWFAVRAGLGSLSPGVRWSQVLGIGFTAGIGFTVSLLIAELAFESADLQRAAKAAVLAASAIAAVAGAAVLRGWPADRAGGREVQKH